MGSGFLNIGFFTKSKLNFFWITRFTGLTAGLDWVSKQPEEGKATLGELQFSTKDCQQIN